MITNIILFASFLSAIIVCVKTFGNVHSWVLQQSKQDSQLQQIKTENAVLTRGILACLKGLAQQGCDGPVHDAIDQIQAYLISKAHGQQ